MLSKNLISTTVILMAASIFSSNLTAGECGPSTSTTVAAIPFSYYITQNKGRWVTLAATSNDIEWNDLDAGWPTRYKAFKYGGGAAIREWKLDSIPSNGDLYEGTTKLSAGAIISDPDDLYYKPKTGFVGSDVFGYCVADSSGSSTVAKVSVEVASAANYPMPVGVPSPGFGINEEPPADPAAWPDAEAAGDYYIDSDHPACDDSNEFGWPNTPRCSIAYNSTVGAGHKMVLASSTKPYPLRSGVTWDRIYLNGTASNPAWIVGDDASPVKPRITLGSGVSKEELRIEGTGNYRVTGIDVDGPNFSNRGEADNVVIRYSRVRNFPNTGGGGTTLSVSSASGAANNVLFFHVNAHDNGIVHPDLYEERDIHAFVGTNQKNFWLIDIMCSENAGDCVQLTNHNTTQNVYVGRATMHSMMENCTDYKDFNNFVVSESDCWDTRKVSYTSGSGGRAQNFYVNDEGVQNGYGYIINNRSWDTSGEDFGTANIGGRVYFIGNRAFFSPEGTGLASSNGGGERHFYFNTVYDAKDGLFLYTSGDPAQYVSGNYFGNVHRYSAQTAAGTSNVDVLNWNAYDAGSIYAWGSNSTPNTGDFVSYKSAINFEQNSIEVSNAGFINAVAFDFRLSQSSQLKDIINKSGLTSIAPGISSMTSDLGVSFVDYNGSYRTDVMLDVGSDELANQLAPPNAPTLMPQ